MSDKANKLKAYWINYDYCYACETLEQAEALRENFIEEWKKIPKGKHYDESKVFFDDVVLAKLDSKVCDKDGKVLGTIGEYLDKAKSGDKICVIEEPGYIPDFYRLTLNQ